jgi:hypothetical protein
MQIPLWLASLLGLGPIVLPLVKRVIFGLGFGLVTYMAVGALLDTIHDLVIAKLGEATGQILAILGLAKVDVAISIIFSALGIKLGFMGLNAAGNLVRARWRWNS